MEDPVHLRSFRKGREAQVERLREPAAELSPTARRGGALEFTELVLPSHANHMGARAFRAWLESMFTQYKSYKA